MRVVTISDSKHQPMNDHPKEFNQIVGEFSSSSHVRQDLSNLWKSLERDKMKDKK